MTAAAGFLGYFTYRFFFAKKQRGSGDSSEESSDPESASLVSKVRKGQKSGRGASGGARSLLLKTQKSGNQASAGLSEEEKIDAMAGRRSGMNGDSGLGRDKRRNSKQGIQRDGMPNASDVSEEDFAGPMTGEAANGMESSGRKIKLPVMYFDSNDEMFFEDEASLEFMEESSCTEVVAG